MSAGLQIFNDNGILTISQETKNLSLAKSGVITEDDLVWDQAGSYNSSASWQTGLIDVSMYRNPILFTRPLVGSSAHSMFPAILDNGNTAIGISMDPTVAALNYSHSIEYFIFSEGGGADDTSDRFGLEIYDENGDPIFHHSRHYLKILDMKTVTTTEDNQRAFWDWGGDWVMTGSFDTSKKIACSLAPTRMWANPNSGSSAYGTLLDDYWIDPSNTVYMGMTFGVNGNGISPGDWMGSSDSKLMIADVTDLPVPFTSSSAIR